MSFNFRQETGRLFPCLPTATFTFRTTVAPLTCMTSSPSFTLMSSSTSYTTLSASSRLACTRKLPRWPSRSIIPTTQTKYCSSRCISSTNLRKWRTRRVLSLRCHLTPVRPLSLKVASSTRKRSTRMLRQSSKKHLTPLATNVILPTTLLSVTTSSSSWLRHSSILLISLRKE